MEKVMECFCTIVLYGSILKGQVKKSTSFDLSNFFIHCESNGISSRFSVYLIRLAEYISTRRVYHQPQAVFAFAMMIYKAFALVIYKTSF